MKIAAYFAATLLLISAAAAAEEEKPPATPTPAPPEGGAAQAICKARTTLPWDQGLNDSTLTTWWITKSTIGEEVPVPEGGTAANYCSETRLVPGCSVKMVMKVDTDTGNRVIRVAAFHTQLNQVNYYERQAKKAEETFSTFTSEIVTMNAQAKPEEPYNPVTPIPPNIIADNWVIFSILAVGEKKDWGVCALCAEDPNAKPKMWVMVKDDLIHDQTAYEAAKVKIEEAINALNLGENIQDVATEIKDFKVDEFLNAPPSSSISLGATVTATVTTAETAEKPEGTPTGEEETKPDDPNAVPPATTPPDTPPPP